MMDFLFLGTAVFIALLTPKTSQYKLINYILVADFAVFIGADFLVIASGVADGAHIDAYKGVLYFMFYVLYMHAGGQYLAKLSALMVVYHVVRSFSYIFGSELILSYDYSVIMGIVCCLYLLVGFAGMMYGIIHRSDVISSRSRIDSSGSTRCHH